jgi:hypothetical protein
MTSFDDVEVQSTLTGEWSRGFQLVEIERDAAGDDLFRLRRRSDGFELPATVPGDRVRAIHPPQEEP